ncbi:MAG: helix-turn-helix domain-containing protein [Egibacteraceae bacterium]
MTAYGQPDVLRGLSRQNSTYRRVIEVCDDLADAALTGCGPERLTEVFAGRVGKRVVLLDPLFQLRAQSGSGGVFLGLAPTGTDPSVDRLLRALRSQRRPMRIPAVPGSCLERACLVTPVVVRDQTLGYLLVLDDADGPEPDDADLLTITYAATLFALTLAHETTSAELELRLRSAVVDELVSGHFLDTQDAQRKAASLGLRVDEPFRVGVVRLSPTPPGGQPARVLDHRAIEEFAHRVSSGARGTVVAVRESDIVAIIPEVGSPRGLTQPSRPARDGESTCGLSEILTAPDQAPRGFRQAEMAVEFGVRLGRAGETIPYTELGIYRLLLEIGDLSHLGRFAEDVLGSLVAYDVTHKQDLIRTLSVYLHHHGSLKQTARTLQVHANTIAYRVQRIQHITTLDLSDPEDRLMAHVAVKIVESLRVTTEAADVPPSMTG